MNTANHVCAFCYGFNTFSTIAYNKKEAPIYCNNCAAITSTAEPAVVVMKPSNKVIYKNLLDYNATSL